MNSSREPVQRRKTFYFDWAVFQLAFEGSSIGAPSWKRRVTDLIYRIGADAQLCFSCVHLFDLLGGQSEEAVMAKAKWLETLPLTFVRNPRTIEETERENLARHVCGEPLQEIVPTTNSFILMLFDEISSGQASDLLRDMKRGTFSEYCRQVLREAHNGSKYSLERMRKASLEQFGRLAMDRKMAVTDNVSQSELESVLLKRRAEARRLDCQKRRPLAKTQIESYCFDNEKVYRHLIPYNYLFALTVNASGSKLGNKNPYGRRFQRHSSTLYDMLHLVGAAYCDYFSCDQETGASLGSLREELGLVRQLLPPTEKSIDGIFSLVLSNHKEASA